MIDETKITKKLQNRIDEFVKTHPDQRDCESVQAIKEFIQLLKSEVAAGNGWIPCSERMPEVEKMNDIEKNKVTSLEIIVRMIGNKPYYEIKYKKLGEDCYNIGYSSYSLKNVLLWKDKCFEFVESKKTNADKIREMSNENLAEWITNICDFEKEEEPYKSIYNLETEKEEEIHNGYGDLLIWLRSEAG